MTRAQIKRVAPFPASARLSQQRLECLSKAAELSVAMHNAVSKKKWSELVALQKKRDWVLREALNAPFDDSSSGIAAAIISDLLEQNENIVNAVSDAKIKLSREYAQQRALTRATRKYLHQR